MGLCILSFYVELDSRAVLTYNRPRWCPGSSYRCHYGSSSRSCRVCPRL